MNELLILFLVMLVGVGIGRLKFHSFSLGVSGALYVGLIFGHFGFGVSHKFFELSLLIFVTSVGLLASRDIGHIMMKHGIKLVILAVVITGTGALLTFLFKSAYPEKALIEGVFTGALTSSPGLGASLEVTNSPELVTIGHSVSYLIGVIAVILFVQLVPILGRIDIEKEKKGFSSGMERGEGRPVYSIVIFSLAVVAGGLIGMIPIPLGPLGSVSLGNAGGGLIGGLLVGYLMKRHTGKEPSAAVLSPLRETMLAMYLAVVGLEAGEGFVEIVVAHGAPLLGMAAVVAFVPMIAGLILGRFLWRMDLVTLTGGITGGMTSTPGLGVAIDFYKTEDIGAGYGAAYPFAIVCMVVFAKLLAL
jgi:putative transport protein